VTDVKDQISKGRSRFRNDIIFIAAVVFLAVLGAVYLFFFRAEGDVVRVTVNGELYAEYSLSENISEDIRTGENSNFLIIKDGRAYIESASCPDGICVNHHPIFRDGESIVCLPNKVVVTVTIGDESDKVDIVA